MRTLARSLATLATLALAAAALVTLTPAQAQAAVPAAPTLTQAPAADRVATHKAWVAEHAANRACRTRLGMPTSTPTGKYTRCVQREYTRRAGHPYDGGLGDMCATRKGKRVCGVAAADTYLLLPSQRKADARTMYGVPAPAMGMYGVTPSPYGNLRCRVYTYTGWDVLLCSNGLRKVARTGHLQG